MTVSIFNSKKTHSISTYKLLYVIASLIYMIPTYFKNVGIIYIFYNNLLPMVSVVIVTVFFLKIKNKKLYILISLFYFVIILSTFLHHGDTFGIMKVSFNGLSYCALTVYIFERKNYKNCIKYIIAIMEILVAMNLITVILFPQGLYLIYGYNGGYSNPAYLLGHRNNAVEYMIPLIGLCVINDVIQDRKISINTVLVLVLSLLTSILTWSANAILCIAFVILACTFVIIKKKFKLFNIWFLYLASAVISILLIVFRFQERYAELLVNLLRRDVTLSSRAYLWERALIYIRQSPVIGYGVEVPSVFYWKIGHMSSCHNYFLDFLYQGGIILLIIVTIIMIVLTYYCSTVEKESKARISIVFGAYMILWIETPVHRDSLFVMFSFFLVAAVMCQRKGVLLHDSKNHSLLLVRRRKKA